MRDPAPLFYPWLVLNAFLFSPNIDAKQVYSTVTLTFCISKSLMLNICLNLCYDFLLFGYI